MIKLFMIFVLTVFIPGLCSAETKELMYTNDRTVYAYNLKTLKLWDEIHKLAADKSQPREERVHARDRLVWFAAAGLVSFFKVNTAMYAMPVLGEETIMKAFEPTAPSFIFFIHKSAIQLR